MDKHTTWKIEQVKLKRRRMKRKWDEIFGRIVRTTRNQMFFDDKFRDWLIPSQNPGKWLKICVVRADQEWEAWMEAKTQHEETSLASRPRVE